MRRVLVVVTVYYLIFGYGQIAAAWLVSPAWRPDTPDLLVLLVGPAAGWLVHQAWRTAWTRWLQRAVYLWVGLAFLLLCVVAPIHVLRLLGLHEGGAAWLLAAVYVPLALWSIVNAHRLEVRRIEISSPKLDRPVRLVQVSDVHVGSRGSGFLPRIVRRVNALRPDAVLVTGDLIDLKKLPADALDSMGELAAPAFFAIGNHERYIGSDAVCARLEALGVTVLRNACTGWREMRIIGIDDAEARNHVGGVLTRMGAGTGECARTAFTILMYHRPDGAEDAARAGVDLMLCGHTHNGQIVPFDRIVKRHFPRIAGRFDIDGMVLYVSAGTGTWGPTMRLGSSNEITVFELLPALAGVSENRVEAPAHIASSDRLPTEFPKSTP
ncbi:MAG: metallophosphoesterase [Gammaproteobacteria bacterium]|nr:metallophosphoesterase [Gammaproteobacteria bacterium]